MSPPFSPQRFMIQPKYIQTPENIADYRGTPSRSTSPQRNVTLKRSSRLSFNDFSTWVQSLMLFQWILQIKTIFSYVLPFYFKSMINRSLSFFNEIIVDTRQYFSSSKAFYRAHRRSFLFSSTLLFLLWFVIYSGLYSILFDMAHHRSVRSMISQIQVHLERKAGAYQCGMEQFPEESIVALKSIVKSSKVK